MYISAWFIQCCFKDSNRECRCFILGCVVLDPSEQGLSGAALQGRRGFSFDGWAGGLCAAGGAVQWRGAVVYGLECRQATGQLLNLKRIKNTTQNKGCRWQQRPCFLFFLIIIKAVRLFTETWGSSFVALMRVFSWFGFTFGCDSEQKSVLCLFSWHYCGSKNIFSLCVMHWFIHLHYFSWYWDSWKSNDYLEIEYDGPHQAQHNRWSSIHNIGGVYVHQLDLCQK